MRSFCLLGFHAKLHCFIDWVQMNNSNECVWIPLFQKKRKAKTSLFPLTCFQPSPNPFSLILFLSRGPNSLLLFFFRPETFSPPAQLSPVSPLPSSGPIRRPTPLSLSAARVPLVGSFSFPCAGRTPPSPSAARALPAWPARQGASASAYKRRHPHPGTLPNRRRRFRFAKP